MKILNYEISEKTEKEISDIVSTFSRPVEYADILAIRIGGYGAVFYD